MSLSERLVEEARQDRICDRCGFEREYVRVWRYVWDIFVDGRIEGPSHLRGTLQLVCPGCTPEFVVNPYEPCQPADSDKPVNASGVSGPLGAIAERLEERVAQALYAASSRYFCAEDEHAAFEDCRRQARVVLRAIAGEYDRLRLPVRTRTDDVVVRRCRPCAGSGYVPYGAKRVTLCSVCSGAGLRRIGVITSEGDA